MSEKVPNQTSSGESLEQETALEESMTAFGLGDADSGQGMVLKDWSAQDFANIYVRYRPHLISHARKFLSNETEAEEVVQDAFLYLMTALPELDSELGVLRFLKWKTKMLCIDIIRASKSGLRSKIVPLEEDFPDENQPTTSLERADDAAIIQLALAKLNPRQREALIATTYEDKSHPEVAQQLGLGENAFRQLLFRARASFRQALVGEADIEGKSSAEILTVAIQKAASARNTVLVALVVVSTLAIAPMFMNFQMAEREEWLRADSQIADQLSRVPWVAEQDSARAAPSEEVLAAEPLSAEADNYSPTDQVEVEVEVEESPAPIYEVETEPTRGNIEELDLFVAREAFNEALEKNLVVDIASQTMTLSEGNGQITATNQSGLQLNFAVDRNSQQIVQFMLVEFESEGRVWKAVPSNTLVVIEERSGQTFVSYAATDFLVGDFSGEFDYVSTTDSSFSRSGFRIDLVIDSHGRVVSSQVEFLPKT